MKYLTDNLLRSGVSALMAMLLVAGLSACGGGGDTADTTTGSTVATDANCKILVKDSEGEDDDGEDDNKKVTPTTVTVAPTTATSGCATTTASNTSGSTAGAGTTGTTTTGTTTTTPAVTPPAPTVDPAGTQGKALWAQHCTACHGGQTSFGANSGAILSAIAANRGGMGFLSGTIGASQANAIAVYASNPGAY